MRSTVGVGIRGARALLYSVVVFGVAAASAGCIHPVRGTVGPDGRSTCPCAIPQEAPCEPCQPCPPPRATPIPHLRTGQPCPIPHLRKAQPCPIPHLHPECPTVLPEPHASPPGPIPHLCVDPCAPPSYCDDYLPTVPVSETRAAILVMLLPPNPWMLTQGESQTPVGGRFALNVSRLSDERTLQDDVGNVWESDGEVQLTSVEWVSRAICLRGGCGWNAPLHFGASLHLYSLHYAVFDDLRNFVEEDLLDADQAVIDSHTLRGRELSVTDPSGAKTDLLGSQPVAKVKGVAKLGLPDVALGHGAIHSSFSVGVTSPAFGKFSENASDDVALDAVLAFAVPIVGRLRLTGGASLSLPGGNERYDRLGIDHADVVAGAFGNLEWWVTDRFAVAAGLLWNQAYTENTGLPTDLDSVYFDLGLMYRFRRDVAVHLTFTENVETQVNVAPGSNFDDSQKESDFTLSFGVRVDV
jgi:hypothetical protein